MSTTTGVAPRARGMALAGWEGHRAVVGGKWPYRQHPVEGGRAETPGRRLTRGGAALLGGRGRAPGRARLPALPRLPVVGGGVVVHPVAAAPARLAVEDAALDQVGQHDPYLRRAGAAG